MLKLRDHFIKTDFFSVARQLPSNCVCKYYLNFLLDLKSDLEINFMFFHSVQDVFPIKSPKLHCVKSVQIRSFFWTVYGVFLRIQSECEKIRTRKASNTDTFHAVHISYMDGNTTRIN